MESSNTFGPVISSYSRAEAIADGVLINLSQFQVIRTYWTHRFACTAAVWAAIEETTKSGSDLDGILHDISWMAKTTISQGHRGENTVNFRVTIGNHALDLKLHCGPGDHAEPVLTLMLAYED
jgi:hypothetical protein